MKRVLSILMIALFGSHAQASFSSMHESASVQRELQKDGVTTKVTSTTVIIPRIPPGDRPSTDITSATATCDFGETIVASDCKINGGGKIERTFLNKEDRMHPMDAARTEIEGSKSASFDCEWTSDLAPAGSVLARTEVQAIAMCRKAKDH